MKDINEVLTHGYEFRMGKYFSNGWNFYKEGLGNYLGFTIIFLVITIVIALIPFVNLLNSIIQYALVAGLYIYTRNMLNNKGDFPQFFQGFNSFGQIFLFALVLFAFALPAVIVFVIYLIPEGLINDLIMGDVDPQYIAEDILYMFEENMGMIGLMYMLLLAYFAYLYISYSFTLILIVDRNMNFWDAMETSRKVVAKNFFSFLGMYILMFIMITFGVLFTCGLGIFIAIPFSYLVVFSAYNDIIGPEKDQIEESIEEFGSSETE
ncbi:MAG: hypothetical protein ABFS32_10215 [Bacteroidota bacterium]